MVSLDNSVGKLVYNWYASCLDQDERDRLGAEPLKKLIQDTMGEQFTPYVPNDISDEDLHLEDVLGVVHRGLGVYPLFTISLSVDPRNSSSPTRLAVWQSKPLVKSVNKTNKQMNERTNDSIRKQSNKRQARKPVT